MASIFLFGKTGSGKSSTLNHLFGHDLIPTSSMESCTRDVIEYGCTMDSTHWKVEGLGLGFVDTPGCGDTDGSMQDARNLATINGYIHTKYTKWNRKIYPNIVLVVVNGSDNRMFGIESEFSQMLHVLSKLNIVDRERPNVVIAVTHALNLKKKRFIEKSQNIAKDCTVLSKLHLIIEAPVVFIENDDEDDELVIDGDWKILPDGTRQPLNLFQAMMNLMKESGDEVGVETIRIFFSNAKDFEVEQKHRTPQIPWNTDNNKAIDCWAEIIKEYLIGSQSELYQILLEASKSPELCMSQPEVMVLAHNLRIAKILKPSDIEGEKVEKIKRTLRPYVLNDSEVNILCRVFKLKPTDQLNFDFLGRGCSCKEKTRKVRILDISTKEFSFDKGIFVPLHCHVEQCGALNVDIKYTNEKGLGYRLVFSISRQNLKIKMEYTVRYTLFKVVLNDPTKLSLNAKFDDYLKKYFARVSTNPISQSDLPDHLAGFDGIFGTRLITGIHFGGVLKGVKWIEAFNCTTELIEYVRNSGLI